MEAAFVYQRARLVGHVAGAGEGNVAPLLAGIVGTLRTQPGALPTECFPDQQQALPINCDVGVRRALAAQGALAFNEAIAQPAIRHPRRVLAKMKPYRVQGAIAIARQRGPVVRAGIDRPIIESGAPYRNGTAIGVQAGDGEAAAIGRELMPPQSSD